MKKCRGFTLIELLIVISLLGILSGVLVSVINPQDVKQRSGDSVRISNIRKIAEAAEVYYNLEGAYPADKSSFDPYLPAANWPDGSPFTEDVYTYTTDNGFTVYTPSSSGTYYVYTGTSGQLLECDGTDMSTATCSTLTGSAVGDGEDSSPEDSYTACPSDRTCVCDTSNFSCTSGSPACSLVREPCSEAGCLGDSWCCYCDTSALDY